MGACASQDEAVLVKPPTSPQTKGGATNSNSTDNSIKTTEREHLKTASNFSKQSYDTTTAGTTASKSIFHGPAGNNSVQNHKKQGDAIPQTIPKDHPSPECAPTVASTPPPPHIIHSSRPLHWASLVQFNYHNILDPADVVFVLDERVCSIIHRLSPAEVSFVQRRVRSVVQSLLKVQGSDPTQPEVQSKAIYSEYGKLDEFAVCKIFSAGYSRAANGRRWWYGQDEVKETINVGGVGTTEMDTLECIWQRSWKEFESRRERRLRSNADVNKDDLKPANNASVTKNTSNCPSDEEEHGSNIPSPHVRSESSSSSSYGSLDNTRSIVQHNATYIPDPISSAYRILSYLSESRWNYVAHTAHISAQRSDLILDVNIKVTTMPPDEASTTLQEETFKDTHGLVPPPLYPGQAESVEFYRAESNNKTPLPALNLPPGVTMKEITFLVALALRGSRIQRLTLLFYLLLPIDELNQVLESHPTGGVPTWLLELETDVVFSLESLSHYYYFGGSPPVRIQEDRDDPSSAKDVHNQLRVDALSVIQLIAGLLYVEESEVLDLDYLSDANVEFPEQRQNGVESIKAKDGDRRRFQSYDYSKYQSAKIYATMTNFLRQGINHINDADFDDASEREQKLTYLDTFWSASEILCTLDGNDKEHYRTTFWTLDEFLSWADESLSDEGSLSLIFGSLFGTGIIPTPSMERFLVSQSWIDWQSDHSDIISNRKNNTIDDSDHLFRWPLSSESENHERNHDDVSPKYAAWGGISGLDGGGQLGYGIMYCLEKGWWDRWTAYVNWPLSALAGVTHRPQDLSIEKLLDFSEDSLMQSQGSYKCMKRDLQLNVDYVMIPPAVWDMLFELYGGGPPVPRFILPFSYDQTMIDEPSLLSTIQDPRTTSSSPLPIFPSIKIETHPWLLSCHLCDPKQPYRRGDAGSQSIRIMAHPNQPMWRLFSEIIVRLKVTHQRGKNDIGQGNARLWKRASADANRSTDPWELLFNNQYAIFPYHDSMKSVQSRLEEFIVDWDTYSNGGTVSSAGLSDGSQLMLEYALFTEKNVAYWPRHAAAKADKMKKITDEDELFRLKLRGLDVNNQFLDPKTLIGLTVDAMDDSGCWYPAIINRLLMKGGKEMDELRLGYPPRLYEEVASVFVRFSHNANRTAWIDVDSDKVAIVDRFSARTTDDNENDQASDEVDGKSKPKRIGGALMSAIPNNQKVPCKLPYFGACALSNLGNTCYMNVSIQCLSYLPFLRSYLVSNQFIKNGDVNRNNPLGSGGVMVDALSELLKVMWSGKQGVIAPKEFRSQLVKVRYQYAGSNQQDAQEFLSDLLDSLHEDCNKIVSKPAVEPLHDSWVRNNSLQTVGEATWRRFLRRNYSLITDVAMGQALNLVTCPVCGFTSRNFDPFSILSLPIPTRVDEQSGDSDSPLSRDNIAIASCLDEFCQEQRFDNSESWRCPNCNDFREGIQKMTLWKLPDILIFHLKRFNFSGVEKEKITTTVTFPLTSLDMSKWCHEGSGVNTDHGDSYTYDLIGVINHHGTMTGGHYIALCKATGCAPDGSEEVSHSFSGASVYPFESLQGYSADQSESWKRRFASNKEKESSQDQALAAMQASKAVAESCEPTWLRFDDDVVEPISPRDVVSEKAYVLFFRRRRISPSNMAKYSTIT